MSKFIDLRCCGFLFIVLLLLMMKVVLVIATLGSVVRNLAHALRVVGEGVGAAMCEPHGMLRVACRCRTNRLVLRQSLVNLPQVLEVVVLECLAGGHAVAIIVDEQLGDDLLRVRGDVWNQFRDAGSLLRCKVELHMTRNSVTDRIRKSSSLYK